MPLFSGGQQGLSAALCAGALMLLPVAADAREFRAADNQSADYPTVQALQFMARIV